MRDTRDVTESTGKWRAIQEEFLATGDAAVAEKSLTRLRDDSVIEAYRAVVYTAFPQGVAMIAAAFYPNDVIVRLSDFKTNEYANLVGGRGYEPVEENPMLGFRGASRYYNERYRAGFGLECRAMKKVRDEMGLTNVKLMVPFCRTVQEGRKVIAEMEKNGLRRGERGLEIYVM